MTKLYFIMGVEYDTRKRKKYSFLYRKGAIKMVNNTENKGTRRGEVAPPSISTEDMIYMEYLIQKEIVRLLKKESKAGGEKSLLAAIKLREERPYLRVLQFFCEHRVQ